MLMSEKQKQPETCMINDTSERNVSTWFRYSGTFDHYITTNLLLSLFWKNFFKSLNIWQSYGGKLIASSAPGHCPAGEWTHLRFNVWYCVRQLCTVQCTYTNGPNSSLDWVLSHWAHFTVLRFIFRERVRYMLSPVRLSSLCLSSVVRPTQAVQIFRNISTAVATLAIHWHPLKISVRSSQGNPSAGGVKHKSGSQVQ